MSNIYTDPPQSRNEAIIKSTIDGTQYTDPPQSRMEDLLLDLKEAIEGGGGGGTTVVANPEGEATDDLEKIQVGSDIYEIPKDYAELDNKPQINGETLSGNKTASELGLQEELDGAQTVEGNPITVADAESMNAESVVVELEPKQDLHGYDAPWVGGAGKNLLPLVLSDIKAINTTGIWSGNTYTLNGVAFEVLTDSAGNIIGIKTMGTASDVTVFMLYYSVNLGSESVTLTGCYPNGSDSTYQMQMYNVTDATYSGLSGDYGNGYTFTPNPSKLYRTDIVVRGGVNVDNHLFYPMIRLATETDPTFAPYSNICPISGYSEVNVERVGKNLFDKNTAETGKALNRNTGETFNTQNWNVSDYINIKENTTYTYSDNGISATSGIAFCYYDSNKGFIGGIYDVPGVTKTITTPSNAVYVRFEILSDALNALQFELGSTATTYEPYQGNTYTIDLDGTRYGGTLDVTRGKMVVDKGYLDLGDTDWDYSSQYQIFVSSINDCKYAGDVFTGFLCVSSQYKSIITSWTTMNDGEIQVGSNAKGNGKGSVVIKDLKYTDTTAFKTAMAGVQLVYPLKTPFTINLTPTDIPLLENTNNISTDGTNITLKYQPNNVIGECKAYTDEQIEKVLPPLPTTDGTYHLSCEVTSGVGVLSWVSDS